MIVHSSPYIIFDISRLISRAKASAATGIDRVELAYALYLLDNCRDRLSFCAIHPLGHIGMLPFGRSEAFVQALAVQWENGHRGGAVRKARLLQAALLTWPSFRKPGRRDGKKGPVVYLLVSHHHLTRMKAIATVLQRWGAIFIPMIHDLIPTEYPEYSRPREPARHKERLKTISKLAAGSIVPSDVVGRSLGSVLAGLGSKNAKIWTIPHGVPDGLNERRIRREDSPEARPYFVCLGTIEPRKNHLLLLHLWRKMASDPGSAPPKLVLIGKRGWENENIVDLLDRCDPVKTHVEEFNCLDDDAAIRCIQGARGLLFPTFSEGFGLPLAEAIALGVPSICADIPVLREVGGGVPEYIDPLDGPGWLSALGDFCAEGPRYKRQKQALAGASFWGWTQSVEASIKQIDAFAERVHASPGRGP